MKNYEITKLASSERLCYLPFLPTTSLILYTVISYGKVYKNNQLKKPKKSQVPFL